MRGNHVKQKFTTPPPWLKIGVEVDYHAIIGGPVTLAKTRVRSDPWQLGHGEWVVLIEDHPGGVSLDAITLATIPAIDFSLIRDPDAERHPAFAAFREAMLGRQPSADDAWRYEIQAMSDAWILFRDGFSAGVQAERGRRYWPRIWPPPSNT